MLHFTISPGFPPYVFDEALQRIVSPNAADALAMERSRRHQSILDGLADSIFSSGEAPALAADDAGFACFIWLEDARHRWKSRGDIRTGAAIDIYLPIECAAFEEDQVTSLLCRVFDAALQDRFPELPRLDALKIAPIPVPLVYLAALPHSGGGEPSWHRNKEIDAFAKAARVVADLMQDAVVACQVESNWPMLELAPQVGAAPGAIQLDDGRTFTYGVPHGFSDWDRTARGQYALDAFVDALTTLTTHQGRDISAELDQMAHEVVERAFTYRWSTGVLHLDDRTSTWLEYESDPDGGRARVVLDRPDARRESPWTPTGCGARAIRRVAPIQDLEPWRSGARARVPGRSGWITVE